MKTWKFGIIGCGAIAEFHIQAIQAIEEAELIMVSSRDYDKAASLAARSGCSFVTDYRQLIHHDDIDIVCVTTSSGSHSQIGIDVLEAGKHLLVEKPIAMTAEEADRLIFSAERLELNLGVVSQRRFEAQHQWLKRMIDEGKLGKLLLLEAACPLYRTQAYYDSASWRGTVAHDGGAMLNQGIHMIDLLLWLGGSVKSVQAKLATQTHEMEAEDLGLAILSFENGAYGTMMASTSIQPGFTPTLCVYGDKGSVKLEGTKVTHCSIPGEDGPKGDEQASDGTGVADPKAISTLYHKLQIKDFIHSIEHHITPLVSGKDGKQAVALVEAIYASSRQSVEVQIGEGSE